MSPHQRSQHNQNTCKIRANLVNATFYATYDERGGPLNGEV